MLLLAQNDTHLHSIQNRLERCRKHFAQVCYVFVEVAVNVLSSVLVATPVPAPDQDHHEAMSAVPSEDEMKLALGTMKNWRTPSADNISAELLKLGGVKMMQWLVQLAEIVWEEEIGARALNQTTHHPSSQEGIFPSLQ